MGRRQWSDQEKSDALTILAANGGNVALTARQMDISEDTLRCWAKGRGINTATVQLHGEKKEALADRLESLLHQVVGVIPDKLEKASLHEVNGTIKIASEAMQLLRGKPTSIKEDVSDSDRSERVAALLDRGRARRAGQPAPGVESAVN